MAADGGTGVARNLLIDGAQLATSAGNWVLARGAVSIRQDVECALRFYLGEWFADRERGFPWLQRVLGQKVALEDLAPVFRDYIAARPGVQSVTSVEVSLDAATRVAAVEWEAQTDVGLLNSTVEVSV